MIGRPPLSRSTVPTADARSHGRHRDAGVSRVPSLIRSVTIAAAPSVTHACSPQTASQVKGATVMTSTDIQRLVALGAANRVAIDQPQPGS